MFTDKKIIPSLRQKEGCNAQYWTGKVIAHLMGTTPRWIVFVAVACLLLGFNGLQAQEYFVSPSGSDSNPGTLTHPFATLQKGLDLAQPGDTVSVRAGTYRQTGYTSLFSGPKTARFVRSGLAGAPITLRGYPGEEVILDGSVELSGWQACSDHVGRCDEIPSSAGVYWVQMSSTVQLLEMDLFQGDTRLAVAQDPNVLDSFYWQDPTPWRVIPSIEFTFLPNATGTIVDPEILTQTTEDYWKNSYVHIWSSNNNVFLQRILRFEPYPVSRLTFDTTGTSNGDIELGKDSYALWNHPSILDQAGECFLDETTDILYLRPLVNLQTEPVRWNRQSHGLWIAMKSYLTIEHFTLRGYSGSGIANIQDGAGLPTGLTIRNNTITQSGDGISLDICADSLTENNTVFYSGGTGIAMNNGPRNISRNNNITKVARSGIRFFGVTDGRIENNYIHDSHGQHANGITVYLGSDGTTIAHNRVVDANICLTFQQSSNLTIQDNVFDGLDNTGWMIAGWGGLWKEEHPAHILITNNTMLHSDSDSSLFVSSDFFDVTIQNNILDGGGNRPLFTHNLYTAFTWNEESLFGPENNPKADILAAYFSSLEADLAKIFVNPAAGDYALKPGVMVGTPTVNPWTMATDGGPVGARDVTPPGNPPSPPPETTTPRPPRAFPVPWDPAQHPEGMTLAGFDPESNLFLYTATGRKLRTFITKADGTYLWDGRDNDHQLVPPGVYLLSGYAQGMRRTLKVAVQND